MTGAIVAIIILASILSVLAVHQKQRKSSMFKFFKPLPLIVLLMMIVQVSLGHHFSSFQIFIVIGLLFGMAGDIFLANEARFMLQGLGSFLVGHIMYIIAFYKDTLYLPVHVVALAVFYTIVVGSLLMYLLGGSINKKMRIPVFFYMVTITAMLILALNFDYATTGGVSYLSIGAVLFLASDTILGFDMLIRSLGNWSILILIFYYSAQIIIAFKAVSYYL